MHIKHFTFNCFQTACYLAWDDKGNCAITDPGCQTQAESAIIGSFIESQKLNPVCIMLTHCHFDHIYGMAGIARKYGIPVYAGKDEAYTLENTNPYMCRTFGVPEPDTFPFNGGEEDPEKQLARFVSEGDTIEVGDLRFEVIGTPGHSTGGVCYLEREGKALFSGDTLFAGAIGRSDHPGGDYDLLMRNIFEKLICLDGDTRVFPGHGPSTDIATERMTNPFLLPFNEPYEEQGL